MLLQTLVASAPRDGRQEQAMDFRHNGQRPCWSPAQPSVRVHSCRDGPRLELQVHGEVDIATCNQLSAALMFELDEGVHEVVVDVSALSFCDLAGSDVLHGFVEEAAAQAITAGVRGMSPLLTMMYREFPPQRPAEVLHGRPRFGWTEPAEHDSRRGGAALEPSGGHWNQ